LRHFFCRFLGDQPPGHCEFIMPQILVVDAARDERRLVASLLAAAGNWTVVEASGTAHALTMTRLVPLDMVVASLELSDAGGVDLIEELSREQPLLPVIAICGQEGEELAREALRTGASGYVARERLRTDLVPAAERLLSMATAHRGRMSLESLQARQLTTFEMDNDPGCVTAVVQHVSGQCRRFGITSEQEQLRVAVALEEALLNAMIHGNLQVGSELRERSDDAFRRLVERRRMEPEYASRRVRLSCEVDGERARIVIRDEGPGFDVASLPDPCDPEYVLRASGRGVLLMRTFMDEVVYNAAGNEVTLIKRRSCDARAASASPPQTCQV
jgi:anti-sigma regulatory factor (Ser/Thr protein kinase)/FixJ family two-component response regulator